MAIAEVINRIAYIPGLGLILVYIYFPMVLVFGTSPYPVFQTDPKAFGIILFCYYFVTRHSIYFFCLSIVPIAASIGLFALFGKRTQLSRISMIQFVVSIILYVVLNKYDPGGYLNWYFD